MKQLLLVTTFLVLFVGCNANENKEARIRKLEAEIKQTTSKLQELEDRVQAIESPIKKSED